MNDNGDEENYNDHADAFTYYDENSNDIYSVRIEYLD